MDQGGHVHIRRAALTICRVPPRMQTDIGARTGLDTSAPSRSLALGLSCTNELQRASSVASQATELGERPAIISRAERGRPMMEIRAIAPQAYRDAGHQNGA